MSYVPISELKAVTDPNLPSFSLPPIDLDAQTFPYIFDSWTLYQSFWQAVTIRNLSSDNPIFYRTTVQATKFDVIPPNSERTIEGWGSFIELREDGSKAITGTMIVRMVKAGDAAIGR